MGSFPHRSFVVGLRAVTRDIAWLRYSPDPIQVGGSGRFGSPSGAPSPSVYTGGRHFAPFDQGSAMVSLSAIAARTGRPRGRPRTRWVEYRTYSCALFVRDGPIPYLVRVASPPPCRLLFFSFLFLYSVTAVGDLCFGDFIVGGESRAHDIASWLTQLTPLPEEAKAITGA